jgi:hypothetical protein
VFDDPFNSQDAFRRRQTVHEIVKLAGTGAQVIVLSHDATFLKQIWDKSAPGERKALLIADQRAQGSKLLPADLEKATQGRTATVPSEGGMRDFDPARCRLNSRSSFDRKSFNRAAISFPDHLLA